MAFLFATGPSGQLLYFQYAFEVAMAIITALCVYLNSIQRRVAISALGGISCSLLVMTPIALPNLFFKIGPEITLATIPLGLILTLLLMFYLVKKI